MTQLKYNELEEIIKLFEFELSTLKGITRIEKMKIRKKVTSAILPAIAVSNLNPEIFMAMMDDKLSDVLDLFLDGWGFREKLYLTVNSIFNRLRVNRSRLHELLKD